jgi:hypothetical protein
MATSVFDTILTKGVRAGQVPARTQKARTWYRQTARKTTRGAAPGAIMRGGDTLRNRVGLGRMYSFFYDPKHKKTLPYYDTFPLIFPFATTTDGFMGINMHYLPLRLRANLMDQIYDLASNDRYDDSTRLKLTYSTLKAASKIYHPTVKRYLKSHVKSRFLLIPSSDWDIALFLPTERFEKASKSEVWRDARRKP